MQHMQVRFFFSFPFHSLRSYPWGVWVTQNKRAPKSPAPKSAASDQDPGTAGAIRDIRDERNEQDEQVLIARANMRALRAEAKKEGDPRYVKLWFVGPGGTKVERNVHAPIAKTQSELVGRCLSTLVGTEEVGACQVGAWPRCGDSCLHADQQVDG